MPFIDGSGAGWDPLDGPDVFFNIENANSSIEVDGSGSKVNNVVSADLPLSWSFTNAFPITNLSATHYISIYDFDTLDPNDLVGEVGFTMSDLKSGYPTTVTKTVGSLTITIIGEWY